MSRDHDHDWTCVQALMSFDKNSSIRLFVEIAVGRFYKRPGKVLVVRLPGAVPEGREENGYTLVRIQ